MSQNVRFTRLALCERGAEIVSGRFGLARTELTAAAQRRSGAGLMRALILAGRMSACQPPLCNLFVPASLPRHFEDRSPKTSAPII
jgi:hypothetical protein